MERLKANDDLEDSATSLCSIERCLIQSWHIFPK